jgi:crotonobetaine/carnitine-CoA ligase
MPIDERSTAFDHLSVHAAQQPEKIYLSMPDTGETMTYGEASEQAHRVASGLLARGHKPGHRIVQLLPNCSAFITSWLAAAAAGLVEVPLNTAYRGSFLEHQLAVAAPTAIITTPGLATALLDLPLGGPPASRIYLVEDGDHDLEEMARSLRAHGHEVEPYAELAHHEAGLLPRVHASDLAAIYFTSGTSGPSKGVTMTHRHMSFFAREGATMTALGSSDVLLSCGPLFHGNSSVLAAYPSLLTGATFVLHRRFSASRWATWIRESGATVANLVGVMMELIWKQSSRVDDEAGALRCVYAGPTAWGIVEAFGKRFGVQSFVEAYGMTEVGLPIMTPLGADRPVGAAGLGLDACYDLELVHPGTRTPVAAGRVGELLVRPRLPGIITSGYSGMPEATAAAFDGGWFRTGDLLRRDHDGWYYFVDRCNDALRRRGENISSYELEEAISRMPGVVEVAVVGVPADEDAGEQEVLACIVVDRTSELTARGVWRWCDESLPYFAVPRYIRFMDALPKTPSEKVQKAELRRAGKDDSTLDRVAVLGSMPRASSASR